jgi:hypothetical protein
VCRSGTQYLESLITLQFLGQLEICESCEIHGRRLRCEVFCRHLLLATG